MSSTDDPKPGNLYLGLQPDDNRLELRSRDLTTHGVIVGMTGSGKTGLGVILLEELLASDVPCLVLDPKGDMGNLLLNFPEFRGEDFEPWVDPAEAERKGVSTEELGRSTAELWKGGLARSGITPERMRQVRPGADIRILTPGSTAGIPLNLVGDLSAPGTSFDTDSEVLRDEIEGLVSGILLMAGLEADPLTSREHILLSNLVENAWRKGEPLDLFTLIQRVQNPPLRKLGVFDLERFFPEKDRTKLAMRLNGLVASPAFAEWIQGEPLDVDSLLRAPDGRPRASVIHLAHLSDAERMFVVTRILTKLVSWMRQQPGTSELRALVYADEIVGFAPPTAEPPTKRPILTLFKQARAHGLGVVLATQNPVDVDYKVMSNAGAWMVGRLQTERDKLRILEGLKSASGEVDVEAWDARIGQLAKREFLLRTTRSSQPSTFSTRWAMSYLRGPLARAEIVRLRSQQAKGASGEVGSARDRLEPDIPAPGSATVRELRDDEVPLPPDVADGIAVGWLDPGTPWREKVGAGIGSRHLAPGLAARIHLLFDDRRGDLRHEEEWEAVLFPLSDPVDASKAFIVDYDERDFRDAAPEEATYQVAGLPLDSVRWVKGAGKALEDFLYANRTLTCYRNQALGLYSRVGESQADFQARCLDAAEDAADEDAAKLRDRYASKLRTAERRLRDQELKVQELEAEVASRRQDELLAGAGQVLSMFLGGRRRTRGLTGISSRRRRTRSGQNRLHSAHERLEDQANEIAHLEEELEGDLSEIWEEWEARAREIETFEVGLERSDLKVTDLRVFFAPAP